jgi:transaldolase
MTNFRIKLFADGADAGSIRALNRENWVSGFTTNPTLMRKAGIKDYEEFAQEVISIVSPKPISLEVFADDFLEMSRQAKKIGSWAQNVYVKIPVTNSKGESSKDLIKDLSSSGIKLNVTAVFSQSQFDEVVEALAGGAPSVLSVFAGRIADTGVDPVPLMRKYAKDISSNPEIELLWASPREILNLVQAEETGCAIITMTPDLLAKVKGLGKDLDEFSLETVKMFYDDAQASGYEL